VVIRKEWTIRGSDMRATLPRTTGKSVIAVLCAASILAMSVGSVSRAAAADTWETWPRKTADPGIVQKPATDADGAAKDWETYPSKTADPGTVQKPATDANGAAKDGETSPKATGGPGMDLEPAADVKWVTTVGDAEKKPATGKSYGKLGWIALGIAAAIGIAIAAGGSGGGGEEGGGVVINPGHH